MAIPSVVTPVGALTTGLVTISPAMPPGSLLNDVLIMQVQNLPPNVAPIITNQAGGTWAAVGGFGGSAAGAGARGTWFWSRYNGTQTAPTLTHTTGSLSARIIAVRGCITTGSPIHADAIGASTFAQTLTTLPTLTTTLNDCLILDGIAGELPDLDGTNVFGSWTNSALSTPTEVFDDSISTGTGGSLGMQAGGLNIGGATGTTSVTHASMRVAYKKLALTPAVAGPTPRYAKNARGQVLIDGVTRFPLLIYDSGLGPFQDQAAHLVTRNMARFTNKLDLYLNFHNGTFGNSLRFATALATYNMYAITTANAVTVFELPIPGPTGWDVNDNPTYTIAPAPAAPFRTQWAAHARTFGTYLYDEPSTGGYVSGTGVKTAFTARGTLYTTTPPELTVYVAGVLKTLGTDYTVATHAVLFDGVQPPNYTVTFAVAPPAGTFNVRIRRTTVFDSMIYYQGQLKSQMPGQFTFGALLNNDLDQYKEWSALDIGDTIGSDIYTIGQGPESATGPTYGFMNWTPGEATAMSTYYAIPNNKVPNVVLQLSHFGSTSRYITTSEIRSHCISGLTELKGRGIMGWWGMGVGGGAIQHEPFTSATSNGTNTTYNYPVLITDSNDLWVDVNGARLAPSQYTVNNVGTAGPLTVTLVSAPPAGQSVVVTARSVGLATRELWLSTLETLCTMIKDLEAIMLTPDDPTLIENNTTWFPTAIAWRISLLQLLSSGGTSGPTWLFGQRLLYTNELALLQQVPPDTSLSDYILDQRGHVRTASWEVGTIGLVPGYNVHPDPQTATFTWHRSGITRVEVLGEGRDVPVTNGDSWTDTFGGASALRQGPFHQGHVYRLTLSASLTPTMPADPGGYGVTGATVLAVSQPGPTVVGFVHRV